MRQMAKHLAACWAGAWMMALAASAQAQGQAVEVRPGLWMTGTRHLVDGKPTPASQGPLGALPEADAREVRLALKPLGLPEGYEPTLECQTATAIDFQSRVMDMARDMCSSPEVQVKGTRTTFRANCRAPTKGDMRQAMHSMDVMSIDGMVDAVSPVETRIEQKIINTNPERKRTIEVKSVARWLGDDCTRAPQGLRADLFNQLVR